ncbi:alpha/beta fold hydrolase [Pseudoprimorskyibacter insulae]|uniref:Lysophospholipase L2 n=1 Tax=Pseudoprimorskyibacter insulae TaxID=1695997 RepID=A0A2R8AQP5_9RHOB|nr:alpha/beta hydrolase [Pseudoprimorskyibacter insulae]SPF78406.1 Lysophospholipase L2 [Pseudoprimorskyibacter insulae]
MILSDAPLFADLADGPEGARGYWLRTEDGVRVRVGHFPSATGRGTILLFPGRTEYIEKYGRNAKDFADHGYDVLAIDWRGQGLADRLTSNRNVGHVEHFIDYQMDVAAMVAAAQALNLPRPWYLLAHSMGGAIGLRAAMEGLPVEGCIFSAPMWGIQLPQALRPVAWTIGLCASQIGCGSAFAPSTKPESQLITEDFSENKLTRDRDMYDYMRSHVLAQPDLGLGGPSLRWLYQALSDSKALSRRPSPNMPCITWLGSDEAIVDADRIRDRMAHWPGGTLEQIPGGRHEMLMEHYDLRRAMVDRSLGYLQAQAAPANARSA